MEFLEERRLNDRATIVNNFNVSNNKEEGFISFSFFSERRAIKSARQHFVKEVSYLNYKQKCIYLIILCKCVLLNS